MADEKKEPWLNYLALTTVIFAVCATILGCSWHLSSRLQGMSGRIVAVEKSMEDFGKKLAEHHQDDRDFQTKTDGRFDEVFRSIRSVMLDKFNRAI